MQFALSALTICFAAFLASWPIAFLVVVLLHALAKRWRRVGQVALLLPVWTIAASIGLVHLAPLIAAPDVTPAWRSPFVGVIAIAIVLFCTIAAWGLLLRSFDGTPSSSLGRKSMS